MGEYEPDDSRIVTNNPSKTPLEPERTGPRESETRGGKAKPTKAPDSGVSRPETDDHDRWQVAKNKQP